MNTRTEDFSFRKDGFSLEDIVIEKIDPAVNMMLVLDDMLLEDVKAGDIEGEKALAIYYEIRNKLDDVAEILNNLDRELMDLGFYKKKKALAVA